MKEYLASQLVGLGQDFINAQVPFIAVDEADEDDMAEVNKGKKEIAPWCNRVAEEAQFLGLPSTVRQAKRIARDSSGWKAADIERELEQLQRRFNEEIEAIALFYVPADGLRYYNNTALFGEQFKSRFPMSNAEVTEAGNCLAFDRYSASVFHLSHALEICLRVVFVSLGMPPSIWSVTKWQSLLRRIDGKIKKNSEVLSTDANWQTERPFYEKVHTFLASACNPLRNSTVHVDVAYTDEASVRPIWLGVEAFMRHLVTKLHE